MENESMRLEGRMQKMPIPSMMLVKIITILVVLVGGIALYRYAVVTPRFPKGLSGDQLKAVFLDNGQVYFGKTTIANKDFLLIESPYYLQTQTVLQEPVEEGKEPQQKKQLSLSALGAPGLQIHGPTKELYIPWSSILYVENLRDDSQVVKLINENKDKGDNKDTNTSNNTNK